MKHLDLQVIEQALAWAREGETLWLCTVLSTFGSSPREPGSWLVARSDGKHVGSLSGGCVEEDFLARVQQGEFDQPVTLVRYGENQAIQTQHPSITLPCGGILEVLVERLIPDTPTLVHLEVLHATLLGQRCLTRCVDSTNGSFRFLSDNGMGPRVEHDTTRHLIQMRIGPSARLIIAGISPVSVVCAEFAKTLGFEVIVCDPRDEARDSFHVSEVEVQAVLPSLFISSGGCHASTAVVALSHDPRIDDLAMIEAVRTPAFYIGVMGSLKTSQSRRERLLRSGGLSEDDIARLHMPIGLDLGSKTPAEIALSVMADIVRVQRDKPRDQL
ncbi:XdhC family protein [Halomonas binhaiensis]|uniref:XdhC family protein n=1 Tax=Halomonas binhaiensis TaxID=2562282 RepID=A0A5C1NC33_9GAMM|nr:XdhC family protein [Halomonas binhaiensis]QEM81252.1 XdhC family protein [Halomonas binhaiensis]